MTKSVTFTGHRYIPQSKRSDLCTKLEKAIKENHTKGVRNFLCGMAVGFDLLAAEAVLRGKKELPNIILTAVVPFPFSMIDGLKGRSYAIIPLFQEQTRL